MLGLHHRAGGMAAARIALMESSPILVNFPSSKCAEPSPHVAAMAFRTVPHSSPVSMSFKPRTGFTVSCRARVGRVSKFSRQVVGFGALCYQSSSSRVTFDMLEKLWPAKDSASWGMRWCSRGVGLDSDDLMMVNRSSSSRRRRSFVVVRAQRSRFFTKYSRSAQDKIESLVKTLCKSEESVAVTLDKEGHWMKPPDWFNVLDGIGRHHRWLLALEVFRWIQVQKWYKADNGYYSKLISIMGKERQYRMAMSVFKEMRKMGCRPDTSLYNSIITVHLRSEDKQQGFTKACSLLEEMKMKRRCQPNIVTYNILTRAAAQMVNQDNVNLLFKDIFHRDLSPDIFTFNGIMDAYGKTGEIVKMEAMFKRMRDDKLKPDAVTFNTLIDAYGRAAEFEKMEQVLRSMTLNRKPPIKPAAKTFNSMIFNYGNAGLVEKFESVFQEMKQLGVPPSFITYEVLIGAYGRCGQFDRMKNCLKRMKLERFTPQPSTLNKMLNIYCHHGMTSEADALLTNPVQECGVQATSLSYAIVIRGHRKAGHHSKVLELLDRMKTLGIKPTRETYMDVMGLIGLEMYSHEVQNDDTAGTIRDLDELSSHGSLKDAEEGSSSHAEDMVGAAA